MARAVGLMDPAQSAKSSGPFKDGLVRIDQCCYKVHKGKAGDAVVDPVPATKWSWKVTRLSEDGMEPLVDENDQPLTEELLFSFGGKSLPFVHPGKGDGPDDEEPEDLGTSEGAEGNTIYLVAVDWKPNERSGLITLTQSLVKAGVSSDYLNRCWAPDWVGCIFEVKHTKSSEKAADGREFNYKIVSKVIVGPGGSKKASKANGAAAAATNGTSDAEAVLAPILQKLSEELDGESLTRKAFMNRVRAGLDSANTDAKLLVPVLSLLKDDKWLAEHAETFDYKLDPKNNSIIFGNLPF